MENSISEVTRRSIADFFTTSRHSWSGRLPESAFLARLYDLARLPSNDRRVANAAADIRQHRENWADWPEEWVFTDERFNLLYCEDDVFLRFVTETVHPIIRPDADDAKAIVNALNEFLLADGVQLVERGTQSGHPLFEAVRQTGAVRMFEEPTGWAKTDRQLREIRVRLDAAVTEEQFQAIGLLCREALISLGQVVFDPSRHKGRDSVTPSNTDAKRLLEAFFDAELGGSANEEARAHARAAVRLALALQHKRTAEFRTAALCAEATASTANLAAILANRRRAV